MVEQIMYLAIGFLVAMLLALMIAPLVHNRAVRLTTKRLEAATPLSMAEIQADKDQLRAEFAMSTRRLELTVEQLKNKTTSQFAELGKKADGINRLKAELAEKKAAIFDLQTRGQTLNEQLRKAETELAAKAEALNGAEATLAENQAELARLNAALAQSTTLADTREIEVVALRTQIEELKARLGDTEKQYATTQTRLETQRGETAATGRERDEARNRVESLSQRVGELDRQLLAQVKEAETLGRRVRDLEQRLTEREAENKQLRAANEAALRTVGELRNELDAASSKTPDVARLRKEKAALEDQLGEARDDRAKTQRELTALQQKAENSWATERMENALLRERINDIAAEVAKLAITLEGPDSPIQAMLAQPEPPAAGKAANGAKPAKTAKAGKGAEAAAVVAGGTLAERIRALQSHASRARQIG
jgi:chromosome segregation ATPase